MKTKTLLLFAIFTLISNFGFSQENKLETKKETKASYYEGRGKEDAAFEQSLKSESKQEEKEFWENQKEYEQDLKRNDRKAYRAYMRGKRDAYAEHHEYCGYSCHHSDHYYNHCRLYTSPSPRDVEESRMPSSA